MLVGAWIAPLGLASLLCLAPEEPAAILANGSFDEGPVAEDGAPPGWRIAVYGATPMVTLDSAAPGLAGSSLRIESAEPSDTAIYQDVRVEAGRWYRIGFRVRTEGLRAATSVYGAVCACEGPSPFAFSENHGGTTEWVEEELLCRAPSTGILRVAVFFVGFGKGTGTAWFDGIRLEPLAAGGLGPQELTISRRPFTEAPISPWIYGNFVEFLDHHVQGMRAQMLDDVSFEGILPPSEWCYWVADRDVEDRPWRVTGYGGDGTVERVGEGAFNGEWCYRIAEPTSAGNGHGIRQRGLTLRAGQRYTLTLWARQEGVSGDVRVSLGRDWGLFVSPSAEATLGPIGGEWSKQTLTLIPDADDGDAELSIRLEGTGTLWLDQVTLSPEDNLQGWRRDVVEATRELAPRCLRFGGSAVIFYDWTKGTGDPDRRVPFPNVYWGRMEPNDVGVDEFLAFCELVGAEPLLCVSYNVGGPADAAAQVEYVNGAADTPWGARRAANGHPEPWGVRLWQVGNEQSGEEYERKLPEYCRAMLAVDPTIELLTAFPSEGVVTGTRDLVRYVAPHYYSPSVRWAASDIEAQREQLARLAPGRDIRLAVTEWNGSAGDWGPPRGNMSTQANALYCARMLHLYQRNADMVAIANRSGLMNGWCCGNIQTSPRGLWVTPAYWAMSLLSRLSGEVPLGVTDADGRVPAGADLGSPLDVAATSAEDGRVVVSLVNEGPDTLDATLDLSAWVRKATWGQLHTLAAGGPNAVNDEPHPERVHPESARVRVSRRHGLALPAWSLTVLEVLPEEGAR